MVGNTGRQATYNIKLGVLHGLLKGVLGLSSLNNLKHLQVDDVEKTWNSPGFLGNTLLLKAFVDRRYSCVNF